MKGVPASKGPVFESESAQWLAVLIRGGSRGRVQGVRTPPLLEMTCGFLIQLVFCEKKTMWFIGVEVEQETIAPPPKKNPGSAPADSVLNCKSS